MKSNGAFMVFVVALALMGCSPDPRNYAEADATQLRALTDARAANAEIDQSLILDDIRNNERRRISSNVTAVQTVLLWVGGVCVAVLAVAGTTGGSIALVRTGQALGHAAVLRARLIALPKSTMQYPLITDKIRGRIVFANPNDDGVVQLDTWRAADRDKLFAAGNVALAGIITEHARGQKDAAGITAIGYNNGQQDYPEVIDERD